MHLRAPEPDNEDLFLTMASIHDLPDAPHGGDRLDDIFGSAPPSPTFDNGDVPPIGRSLAHPTDMTRLRQEHGTAGYREGITVAKAKSIQAGFDEGFSLGATIGMRAGELLGILEGIASAARVPINDQSARAEKLLSVARDELSTKSIFSMDYWAPNGTWKYEVKATGSEEEVDVANSHPLIHKWSGIVEDQTQLWSIDRTILSEDPKGQLGSLAKAELDTTKKQAQTQNALDW